MNDALELTPCGRVPGTPLRKPKHELVAHAFVRGLTAREAGLDAGYKDGPGLKGNIIRLRHTPEMCERIGEIASKSAELAEIHDGWILADIKLFAKASPAWFWKRDAQGRLEVDEDGKPIMDLTQASEEQLRTIKEFKGSLALVHDPNPALDKLARHRGLYAPTKVEATGKDGGPMLMPNVSDADRARALAAFVAKAKVKQDTAA